jgi:hypothetical protein
LQRTGFLENPTHRPGADNHRKYMVLRSPGLRLQFPKWTISGRQLREGASRF